MKAVYPSSQTNLLEDSDKPQPDNSKENEIKLWTLPSSFKARKTIVENAIKEKKIFAIHGRFCAIRKGLHQRGWIEKSACKLSSILHTKHNENDRLLDDKYYLSENNLNDYTSWLLRDTFANFVWSRKRAHTFNPKKRPRHVNHFASAAFASKVGLHACLQSSHWFGENLDCFYPRSYCIGQHDEKMAFIDDFRMTACRSVLKWVVESQDFIDTIFKLNAEVLPPELVEIALVQCDLFLKMRNHEDIDCNEFEDMLTTEEWLTFLDHYYHMIEAQAFVQYDAALFRRCQYMLLKLNEACPSFVSEGFENLWILKPGAKSRGAGIKLFKKLNDILNLVDCDVMLSTKYLVQKYIEKPLLIFHTKFDIRQWFLVTDWTPLTIYIYKDCYLRFCSRRFTLKDVSEAIHLCNNTIQSKYMNNRDCDECVPNELMWSNEDFKNYLRLQGNTSAWDGIIYPRMKSVIINAMLCSQEIQEESVPGAFELFGADFMLTEDFMPWLLEINSSPCLASTTSVTAHLCTAILQDILKVVVDRKTDKNCSIGKFELAYKETTTSTNKAKKILTFTLEGIAVTTPYFMKRKQIFKFPGFYGSCFTPPTPESSKSSSGKGNNSIPSLRLFPSTKDPSELQKELSSLYETRQSKKRCISVEQLFTINSDATASLLKGTKRICSELKLEIAEKLEKKQKNDFFSCPTKPRTGTLPLIVSQKSTGKEDLIDLKRKRRSILQSKRPSVTKENEGLTRSCSMHFARPTFSSSQEAHNSVKKTKSDGSKEITKPSSKITIKVQAPVKFNSTSTLTEVKRETYMKSSSHALAISRNQCLANNEVFNRNNLQTEMMRKRDVFPNLATVTITYSTTQRSQQCLKRFRPSSASIPLKKPVFKPRRIQSASSHYYTGFHCN